MKLKSVKFRDAVKIGLQNHSYVIPSREFSVTINYETRFVEVSYDNTRVKTLTEVPFENVSHIELAPDEASNTKSRPGANTSRSSVSAERGAGASK